MTRIELFGVGVDAVTLDDTIRYVNDTIASGRRGRIVTLNATGLMLAEREPFFRSYTSAAELVVADGQPLVWLAPLFGRRLPHRIPGIDLIDHLAAQAAGAGHGVFLLGAAADTAETAAARLAARHPGLRIAGHHHGYIAGDGSRVAAEISASGANILLVGMGSPRQEQFIDEHWPILGVNIAIGVGGSFEVLADRLRRAPRWMQATGFEWLFRAAQEPRRLTVRYLETLAWLAVRTLRRALPPAVRRGR